MDFKVEMNNIDYSDTRLIKALENISDNIEYKVVISNLEIEDMLAEYIKELLDVDLEISGMYLDAKEARIYYENIFEAAVIINQLIQHFGTSTIYTGGSSETLDYYSFNVQAFVRKLCKFGYIEADEDSMQIKFDQADEFTNTWIYKYIQNKKER